ncbi:hypothetical protein ASPWEDRAFT_458710 [Aspergillus wentii DTO 134E9]|uniref:Uncharacterized protein n=1 Tax=Aspergillus wentii DTO 134E9 TaxID=1073089 RepID=A0A1L9RRS2_ASPWE|nr:uncharacterized protein ASPWEDRAFT_458710 [Aspergillus wentii DTO 134E9]OJJ37548.1 hypothetical protein ASPWEDRAFT_458710 [Aspergillus wentii DTO 134E9]
MEHDDLDRRIMLLAGGFPTDCDIFICFAMFFTALSWFFLLVFLICKSSQESGVVIFVFLWAVPFSGNISTPGWSCVFFPFSTWRSSCLFFSLFLFFFFFTLLPFFFYTLNS